MHVDAGAPISPFGRANLTRIAEFCKKQNIRLVLVTAPLPSAYVQDRSEEHTSELQSRE